MTNRFYTSQAVSQPGRLIIADPQEIHHIKNVFRLKRGDAIVVFDGKGSKGAGVIESIQPQGIEISIEKIHQDHAHQSRVILACAMPKRGKFELIIEKATELGVDEIIPLMTKRTEIILKDDALDKKRERFASVAISAAKQSGRSRIPVIHAPMKLKEALNALKSRASMIIPSLKGERKSLLEAFQRIDRQKTVAFLIGPEGDFTDDEYQLAWDAGCVPVSLGETVLRVETAAICVVAFARMCLENQSAVADDGR